MRSNSKEMNTFLTKIFKGMELFTEIVKNSLLFWLYFIRGLGFLTLKSSIEALTFVSLDVLNKKRIETVENYKEKYNNTNKKRFSSLFLFFFWLYSAIFIIAPVPQFSNEPLIYTLKFILITIFIIQFTLLISEPLLKNSLSNLSWSLSIHVFLIIKEFKWTIAMCLGLVIIGYISLNNFIFLIFVSPGFSGLIVSFCVKKMIKDIQLNYLK